MDHVPHEWKMTTSVVTVSGAKPALGLTEGGLNFFLSRSDRCGNSRIPLRIVPHAPAANFCHIRAGVYGLRTGVYAART
jgi:hypothetical protein